MTHLSNWNGGEEVCEDPQVSVPSMLKFGSDAEQQAWWRRPPVITTGCATLISAYVPLGDRLVGGSERVSAGGKLSNSLDRVRGCDQ